MQTKRRGAGRAHRRPIVVNERSITADDLIVLCDAITVMKCMPLLSPWQGLAVL